MIVDMTCQACSLPVHNRGTVSMENMELALPGEQSPEDRPLCSVSHPARQKTPSAQGLSSCPGQFQVTFPFYLSKSKHEKLSLMQWEDPLSEALFRVHSLRASSSHIRSSKWCILRGPDDVQKHQDESALNRMCPDCVPGVMWGT